ncbi:MAG: hypothetical protein AB1656_26990 [Candidatus Omnitrophota bacterium]
MNRLANANLLVVLILVGAMCMDCSWKSQEDREKEETIKLKTDNVKDELTKIKLSVGNHINSASYTIPADPFAIDGVSFRYYYFERQGAYIISSNGPDQDDDLKNVIDPETMKSNQDIYGLVKPKMYDASNGVKSDGDIIVVGP